MGEYQEFQTPAWSECPTTNPEAENRKHKTARRATSELRSTDWLAVGAEATRLIVEGMLSEARRWEAFASANQLSQKLDYYRGRAAALDELRQVLKVLAPTANDQIQP